jgi:hypothetical protein
VTFPECTVNGAGGGGLVTVSSTGLRFLFAAPASAVEDSIIPVPFYVPTVLWGRLIKI